MKKVLILGGSFDPIHQAHLDIASIASKHLNIKDVWFLIANNPRWKNEPTSFEHRYNMVKLAIKDYPNFSISLEEKEVEETNYTIHTAYRLLDKHPDTQFFYLIGSDQLEKLTEWKEIDDLATIFQFVHIQRQKEIVHFENIQRYNIIHIALEEPLSQSSTEVRHGNFSIVPLAVKKYIQQHYLYLKDRIENDISTPRFEHSLRVAMLARELAIANRYNAEKAFAAGILHDCAKELDKKMLKKYVKEFFPQEIKSPETVYHQYVGALLAQKTYGIKDKDILQAISRHATADINMTTLDKILYCADKLEEGKKWDSLRLIEICKNEINGGFKHVIKANVDYFLENNIMIDKKTVDCVNQIEKNEIQERLNIVVHTLVDRKGENLLVYDVSNRNPLTQYYVIATASSPRHAMALSEIVEHELQKNGFSINHIEGRKSPEWILVDAKDVIIHILTHEARELYNFERLLYEEKKLNIEEIIEQHEKRI